MNLWIDIKRPELVKLLERVDMLLLNDEEARQLSGQANLPAAARAIRAMGPGSVVIKRGDAGALLFHEGGVFAAPAFPIEDVVDPTGAGDSFAGGFMGWLAREGNTSRRRRSGPSMIMGSVLASFSRRGLQPRPLPPAGSDADPRALRRVRRPGPLREDQDLRPWRRR